MLGIKFLSQSNPISPSVILQLLEALTSIEICPCILPIPSTKSWEMIEIYLCQLLFTLIT